MKKRRYRSSWCSEILNPFDFVNRNCLVSNYNEQVHATIINIYEGRVRIFQTGTQMKEDNANNEHSYFNSLYEINMEF